ncbi:unnamed protein product, partial [Nesidiocoris tenuis]
MQSSIRGRGAVPFSLRQHRRAAHKPRLSSHVFSKDIASSSGSKNPRLRYIVPTEPRRALPCPVVRTPLPRWQSADLRVPPIYIQGRFGVLRTFERRAPTILWCSVFLIKKSLCLEVQASSDAEEAPFPMNHDLLQRQAPTAFYLFLEKPLFRGATPLERAEPFSTKHWIITRYFHKSLWVE